MRAVASAATFGMIDWFDISENGRGSDVIAYKSFDNWNQIFNFRPKSFVW